MAVWDFVKMQGIGNDFVVVDERGREAFPSGAARGLCDRHTGIGADGVLVIGLPRGAGAIARMDVWNADGSAAEMCGNGIRCVARRLVAEGAVAIETGAGVLSCTVLADGSVDVDMGPATLEGVLDEPWRAAGISLHATRVRTGNPHLVTFDRIDDAVRAAVASTLSTDPAFPAGTNVEIAVVEGERIRLAVWERGVGFTRACGTGACATVAAACATGRLPYERAALVSLPGGDLVVTALGPAGPLRMRGPAEQVYDGRVELPFRKDEPPGAPGDARPALLRGPQSP
jgi:diaminopimelate epimerase